MKATDGPDCKNQQVELDPLNWQPATGREHLACSDCRLNDGVEVRCFGLRSELMMALQYLGASLSFKHTFAMSGDSTLVAGDESNRIESFEGQPEMIRMWFYSCSCVEQQDSELRDGHNIRHSQQHTSSFPPFLARTLYRNSRSSLSFIVLLFEWCFFGYLSSQLTHILSCLG